MAAVKLTPARFDDLDAWVAALLRPNSLLEIGVLVVCALLAWALVRMASRRLVPPATSVWFGRRGLDGVLFPAVWLLSALLTHALLAQAFKPAVFPLALAALGALVVIRIGVKVLQLAFGSSPLVHALERSISWMAWLAMVLWVSGLLPAVLDELDQIRWKVGASQISLRSLIEGGLTAGAVLLVALWISSAIESRLLRGAVGSDLSLRKAASNALRALLMFIGVLLALSSVGIDLTALSVLGGAIGVGVGFGLQKLAANYVSGFVILAERSLRIGDTIRVDNFEGRVTDVRARYTVIRSLGGRESVVPNEMLITNRVENLTLADPQVWQTTVISVGYDSDVDLVVRLLVEAALSQPRVLRDPAPSAALSNFGNDGLEFTLGYWIGDPENGQLNLRSAINMAILAALRANRIDIPYPQRVVRMVSP
ncbi:MAG: mechanosensitive ion channel [Tibeticola sp.]